MQQTYRPGDRIRISENHHWACGATGHIADGGSAWPRVVPGVQSAITFYLVGFDTPQVDAEGDGPYTSAEIDARYLSPA